MIQPTPEGLEALANYYYPTDPVRAIRALRLAARLRRMGL
jgi:hypothetical protein